MRNKALIDSGKLWTDEDFSIYQSRKSESLNENLISDRNDASQARGRCLYGGFGQTGGRVTESVKLDIELAIKNGKDLQDAIY